MKKTMFIWICLLALTSACDFNKKTESTSNVDIHELNVSHDLEEEKRNQIQDHGSDFDESRDDNEIFHAINNAENGDTIIIQPGTYWGAVSMTNKHNLTLNFSNVSLLTKFDETLFKIQQCSNIHIHGLTIYHDPKLAGCFTNCFDVEHSQNITFTNCDINGSGFIGICINQSSGVEVKDCKIHECQWGVFVWGNNEEYGGKRVSTSEVFINNCVFEQNKVGNVSFDGNYAHATPFRINIDSWDFIINSDNVTNYLNDENDYEVLPKKTEQIISDVISILLPSSYSDGELDPNMFYRTWVGLWRDDLDNSMKCYTTKLYTKPIHNPMDDEDGEMSGTQIYCEGHDKDPMLLISGIDIPEDVQINSYPTFKNRLMPGESMQLGNYTIKALAAIDQHGRITDYQLTIAGEKNGENIEQIFLEQAGFDDAMIDFIWAGDIDQDGVPDLYMDISPKYSYSIPALFLSSKADDNGLLKLVAEFTMSGC
ncbi:MAG: right-handed parallel beta-helix repeat-containing protein [Flavobacteriales bacterium]